MSKLSGKYPESELLQQTHQNVAYFQIPFRCKTGNSVRFFFLARFHSFHIGAKGLDCNKLNATLNPNFDWEAAVQEALKTDDSLEEVPLSFLALHLNSMMIV